MHNVQGMQAAMSNMLPIKVEKAEIDLDYASNTRQKLLHEEAHKLGRFGDYQIGLDRLVSLLKQDCVVLAFVSDSVISRLEVLVNNSSLSWNEIFKEKVFKVPEALLLSKYQNAVTFT